MGIDHIPELVNQSIQNVKQDRPALLQRGQLRLLVADGRQGYPAGAPYDAIHVGAAAPSIPEKASAKSCYVNRPNRIHLVSM